MGTNSEIQIEKSWDRCTSANHPYSQLKNLWYNMEYLGVLRKIEQLFQDVIDDDVFFKTEIQLFHGFKNLFWWSL